MKHGEKAERRLTARQRGYDMLKSKNGYKRPGSRNSHKSFSIKVGGKK